MINTIKKSLNDEVENFVANGGKIKVLKGAEIKPLPARKVVKTECKRKKGKYWDVATNKKLRSLLNKVKISNVKQVANEVFLSVEALKDMMNGHVMARAIICEDVAISIKRLKGSGKWND